MLLEKENGKSSANSFCRKIPKQFKNCGITERPYIIMWYKTNCEVYCITLSERVHLFKKKYVYKKMCFYRQNLIQFRVLLFMENCILLFENIIYDF